MSSTEGLILRVLGVFEVHNPEQKQYPQCKYRKYLQLLVLRLPTEC